jgi:PIN domain nuclease of toxin-antitoxin system
MASDRQPLLLDSHAFVWLMTSPQKVPPSTRDVIADAGQSLLLSTASVWEIATKVGRGRWPEATAVVGNIHDALARVSITSLPVSVAHARAAGLLTWAHRDPFDRMLAAQAIAEGATLVTVDPVFSSLPRDLPLATMWA